MIYTIWTHVFNLPGANTDQYSCDTFSDKRELIAAIADVLEESREPLVNLSIDGTEEELDAALAELRQRANDPETEEEDLAGETWFIGDMEITIHLAESFPEVLKNFGEILFDVAEADLEDIDDEEDDDDTPSYWIHRIVKDIRLIDEETSLEDFSKIFTACHEHLGNWSTY